MYADSLTDNSIINYLYINDDQPSNTLHNLNMRFWRDVHFLANNHQEPLYKMGFDRFTIERIATLDRNELTKLSSGIVLCFMINDKEQSLIKTITAKIDEFSELGENETNSSVIHCFWYFRQMKTFLLERDKGVWSTLFAYGMSSDFLHFLSEASDQQIWKTVYNHDLDYKLRISNRTINSILDKGHEFSLDNAFIPYLEAIANSNINPSCVYSRLNKIDNLKSVCSSFASYSKTEKEQLIRNLYVLGATSHILKTETGLTDKVIRRIEREMREEEGVLPIDEKITSLPSVKFIKNIEISYHATLIMTIYRHIARNYCEHLSVNGRKNMDAYIESTVFIYPLIHAFKIYHAILNEIEHKYQNHVGFKELARLSFNECYALAKELKDNSASFFKVLEVGIEYFYCNDQMTRNDNPFYSNRRTDDSANYSDVGIEEDEEEDDFFAAEEKGKDLEKMAMYGVTG